VPWSNRVTAEAPKIENQHDAPSVIGKSAKRRRYRLWIRPETPPQDGHELFVVVTRIVMTVQTPSLTASTVENPGGSDSEAWRDCMALIPFRNRPRSAPQLHQK
jgi:hypothetical protein